MTEFGRGMGFGGVMERWSDGAIERLRDINKKGVPLPTV